MTSQRPASLSSSERSDSGPVGRRAFLIRSAVAGAVSGLAGPSGSALAEAAQEQAARPQPGPFPVKAISSANGLQTTRLACEQMRAGVDTLAAAVAGVALVEDDPNDTSVGYGGLPNERGIVELDAAVMHGPTHRAGAVAALQNIRHPAQVALKVLDRSDHVLLVGAGALDFARAHGFRQEELLTDQARRIWLHWKETLSNEDDWLPASDGEGQPDDAVSRFFRAHTIEVVRNGQTRRRFVRPTGTIHCAAMNAEGEISCTTTTSGLAFKIPGRVGDSPIIGAGLYVDNDIGSCGSTGRGEANLQNQCCFAAVELMRQGHSPEDAGMEVLRRVAQHTSEPHLLDAEGRPNFGLKFYLLAKDGRHAGVSMWGPAEFAVTDAAGTRHEPCRSLFEKPS